MHAPRLAQTAAFVDRNRGRVIGAVAGRPVYAIAGAEDPPNPDPAQKPDPDKTFTQAEVSAIAAREKSQGKAAAAAELAEHLGVPLDKAKDLIQQALDAENAKKTDADKARDAAEAAKAAADADRAAAATERQAAAIERALVRAGVVDEKFDRAVRNIDVPADADADAIKTAVDALKGEEPTWFGVTTTQKRTPHSVPPGTPPRANGSKEIGEAGRAEALRRFPHLAASKTG
jgi:hypothetical protein